MKDYDGDEEYRKLHAKISQGQALTEEEILKLIFLPLMKSKSTEEDMAIRAAELAKDLAMDIRTFVIGAIVAVTDRILPEEYKRRLLEVLKMTQIEQWLKEEGRAEGLAEGIKKGIHEGMEQGLERGLERGLEKGLLNGKTKATQEAIVLYLTTRYGEASTPLQDTILPLQDLGVLEQLLKALYATANFSQAQLP
ncbi:flagellar assembly protein H [Peptococcaceae bacterium CEB3]|nr:flagellar assembly protein H [Peptococcaceae bacterium CEB3]